MFNSERPPNRTSYAEIAVKSFYDNKGWVVDEHGHSTDSLLWEDLRFIAKHYVSACRRKVLRCLPAHGELILDAASGPIQYPEYLEYSQGFKRRVCVDIAQVALHQARKKLGDHGAYCCTSILNMPFEANTFEAVISLHTIYHIDASEQEAAVRGLIFVAKPNAPIIIVYSNPNRFASRVKHKFQFAKKHMRQKAPNDQWLYFYAYPLSWWKRFEDQCTVSINCWRFLTATESKKLIPNFFLGRWLFKIVLAYEEYFPRSATQLGAYPMLILRKK